jgi:hypothetical protein
MRNNETTAHEPLRRDEISWIILEKLIDDSIEILDNKIAEEQAETDTPE